MSVNEIEKINSAFAAFKIKANCVNFFKVGSSSVYEVSLDPAAKIKDLEKYYKEIALYLQEKSYPRFIPVLNRGIIKIEFIDPSINSINLLDLMKDREAPKESLIPVLLGIDSYGQDAWMSLEDNPHLLIAGCTGSGKSVALHNIIGNILKYSKSELFLIDPKSIEFFEYEKFSNRVQVKYSYEDTLNLLDEIHENMESRFNMMKMGFDKNNFSPIVVIIDEYADLSLQDDDKLLYTKLCKIAQKCRAAKIHLILATQRPSAKLIDGNIKANFPARLACKVATKIDSKIIIDSSGAEELLGKGDALLTNCLNLKLRLKIAFSSPEQNKKILS